MSNSVVKVTDSMLNDSLLLLVGEDGTVSPDKTTVENYLNSKSGATDIQVMHINKSDGDSIDVSIDNLTYIPDIDAVEKPQQAQQQQQTETNQEMDEIARNLYNVRLDHDYTPLTINEEVNELTKTLSILDGESHKASTSKIKHVQKNDQSIKTIKPKPSEQNNKINTNNNKLQIRKTRPKLKLIKDEDEDDDDDEDYDDEDDDEEDEDDSDYEMEESPAARRMKRSRQKIVKTKPIKQQHKTPPKPIQTKQKETEKILEKSPLPLATPTQSSITTNEDKSPEKKPIKKEKKTPKPIPDDFALFSTPDIIRRVGGGKDTQQPQPVIATTTTEIDKPAKIEHRSKSAQESPQNTTIKAIGSRMSLDGKIDKNKSTIEPKKRKTSLDMKRITNDVKKQEVSMKFPNNNNSSNNNINNTNNSGDNDNLDMPSAEEIRDIMNAENNLDNNDLNSGDQTLDGGGLDIDPSLLENLNNDLISEDILYQVAQSLVSNTELQNAIDKSINEGNLVLDPSIIQQQDQAITQNESTPVQESSTNSTQKGTQIVRPDGRIVVIPPIERPTTRSRNKNKEIEKPVKPTHKPLDEEHVSGNELDSSADEEDDEEESEDDPNKLWCICNQPHNNRFMICCDTCEEWYHGKCVNITKAMGQQMESEGKEWICLFCKDPQLKRPQAAARRIRKASRNSRQSSDSTGSTKVPEGGTVPCVVCQKQSRINSIFCSEACILAHAQGVERVVVFERATGNMLTGNKAPSAANLEQWLKEHPGYEVVRSAGKVVTAKQTQPNFTQSKFKLLKNSDNNGVSIAVQKKGVNIGVLKHLPKGSTPGIKANPTIGTPTTNLKGNLKMISKQITTTPQQKIQQKPIQTTKIPTIPTTTTTTVVTTPIKPKLMNQSGKSPSTPSNKDKPMPIKTPKARQAEITPQPKQENIRENVQKTLFEQLTNRLKMVDDLKLTEDEVKSISNEIESQLYKCFGDTGQKYRNKYRSLIFNIKDIKNQTLWRRICEKSINPYQLVRLSPDDLASQELALWREREAKHQLDMIKKSELELLNCNRQYVLKTHKGEQVLEENRPSADNIDTAEVITSLTEAEKDPTTQPATTTTTTTTTKSEHSKEHNNKKTSKHSHRDKEHKSSKDKERHRSSSKDRSRKRSRSRDHSRKRSRSRDKHRKSSSTSSSTSSHKSSRHKKESHSTTTTTTTDKLDKKSKEILEQLVDNKIVPPLEDRLWKHVPQEDIVPAPVAESDSDHEPTSTVSIPTPPRSSETDDTQTNQSVTIETKEKTTKDEAPAVKERSASPTLPPPVSQQLTKAQSAEIWRGVINMIDVAQISITAHEVSGDCNGLGTELPPNLDIVGRISPDTVWDYIGKMKCSNSKIISLVRLNAINVEEKMPYLALYSYLSSRNRLGVVKSTNKAVKDFYILPLASQKPIPQALLPITGPGFEESRPALLLGIIVRDKRKRPLLDTNTAIIVKKTKIEPSVQPQRSYTPPPVKDSKLKLPLPPPVGGDEDDDEPYSPEDSDPDSMATPQPTDTAAGTGLTTSFLDSTVASSFQPFSNKFDNIPGLGNPVLPSSTQELQRQMEKLNKEIEMQKSEINSISQNIATASTEIGSSALANINLPSNLQQILDSIKTISAVSNTETQEIEPEDPSPVKEKSPDLTIPLILPTNFSRPLQQQQNSDDLSPGTIPLNLPNKKKSTDLDKSNNGSNSSSSNSVLGLLSEEDLIKKAAEMLGETNDNNPKEPPPVVKTTEAPVKTPISFSFTNSLAKRPKLEHPPLPGLDDE